MSKITNRDAAPRDGSSVEHRLARLLDTPFLARVVPHLPPETLHQLIRYSGLDACGELVAAATPAQLDAQIAYLTGPELVATPFARAWPVITWLPFGLKALRARLRELSAGAVTVKKRGSPLDADALARQDGVLWVDMEGPTPEDQRILADVFKFHPLAIEDTFTLQHQPKVEEYDDHVFVIVRGLDFNPKIKAAGDRIATLKLAAFLSKNRLVTCHRAPLRSLEITAQRIKEKGRALPGGAAQT